jgi:predicted Kef-type K+ transport protein
VHHDIALISTMATSLVYALEAEGILESPSGQIAVGWLIV